MIINGVMPARIWRHEAIPSTGNTDMVLAMRGHDI
jgi:hypothetical protein